jgi:PAS domain S-box-containing protein
MITAKEIMNTGTPVLAFDKTIEEAIQFLQTHPTNFVAISASEDRLHGVVTEACLMKIFLRYQANPERQSLIFYRDLFEPAQLIHQGEPLTEVVKKIGTAVGNRIFVINDQGHMVGYITAKDVLPIFTSGKTPTPKIDSQLYLYESFFSKSPFMMHSANSEGVIQMANEMLHAVLGFNYGELIGKTIFDLYSKDHHKKAEAGLQAVLDKGYHKVIQSQMVHKNGGLINVELVSRALVDQKNQPIGTITVSRPQDMEYLLRVLPNLN